MAQGRGGPRIGRRTLLAGAGATSVGVAIGGRLTPFDALAAGAAPKAGKVGTGGYGPLSPVRDQATGLELLKLPRGFEYISFGWTGDPMDDGRPTPSSHDGMASFRGSSGRVRLVRNHEQDGTGGAFATGMTYDPMAEGGTTTLGFDPNSGQWLGSRASLAGTIRNCAGGAAPWGSWLSCEETTITNGTYKHGYVFEVPTGGSSDGQPLEAMGRFSHEAVAVDPATGNVYETEDATPSGLYRFVPAVPGDLAAGGTLQMLSIGSSTLQTYDDTAPRDYGTVGWVTIDDPDPATPTGATSTVQQGIAKGGAQFERLEGIWYGDGKTYFVSTSGGPSRGQVFELDLATDGLRMIFSSPSLDVLDSPDNICVSPRGGLVLCEDGSGHEFLHGLSPDGAIFKFAENNVVLDGERGLFGDFTASEWAGVSFDPVAGNWLFANLQDPGITVAITGPWRKGAL